MTLLRTAFFALVCLLPACGSTPPAAAPLETTNSSTADSAPSGSQTLAPVSLDSAPLGSASGLQASAEAASTQTPSTAVSSVASSSDPAGAEVDPLLGQARGPAIGGPKNNRPCEFHESVDSYQRRCTTRKNADGSLLVEAKGTSLNPDNGFEFTLHGGPHNFVAAGTLHAFAQCDGPFVAPVATVIDRGVTTYELRFKQHCKIVIR